MLRAAGAAVTVQGRGLDLALLAELRQLYDHPIVWENTTNQHRDWAKACHSGHNVAKRLHHKTD
ncbi:MAG: hypothetical protein ACRDSH_07190 [Pseudonocardiaceae bacterium]